LTLVLAGTGPESIWLLVDRRLSNPGRSPKDNACKIMALETTDGVALLGYAGLGLTIGGAEPSDWMSAVLRGRKLPLEQSLGAVARAMQAHLPPHMIRLPGNDTVAHSVIVPAFVKEEPKLYSIGRNRGWSELQRSNPRDSGGGGSRRRTCLRWATSLLSGENTGNVRCFSLKTGGVVVFCTVNQLVMTKFPTWKNREISRDNRNCY
jgi:hypothetical protein